MNWLQQIDSGGHMSATRSRRFLLPLLLVAMLVPGAARADQVAGPSYPPPGGVTLSTSGDSGRAGGLVWSYSELGFDFAQGATMWWGPWDQGAIGLAFDGLIDAPGETPAFSPSDSDLASGVAVWRGSSVMPLALGGSMTFPTRLTLRIENAGSFIDPGSVGIVGANAVVSNITGPYRVTAFFEGLSAGVWKPAKDLYDSVGAPPTSSMRTELGAGYWVI